MLRLEVDYLPLLVNSLLEFILDCSELWLGNTHIDQCLISQFNCTINGCNNALEGWENNIYTTSKCFGYLDVPIIFKYMYTKTIFLLR